MRLSRPAVHPYAGCSGGTMGNQVAIACYDTLEEVDRFVQDAFALRAEEE